MKLLKWQQWQRMHQDSVRVIFLSQTFNFTRLSRGKRCLPPPRNGPWAAGAFQRWPFRCAPGAGPTELGVPGVPGAMWWRWKNQWKMWSSDLGSSAGDFWRDVRILYGICWRVLASQAEFLRWLLVLCCGLVWSLRILGPYKTVKGTSETRLRVGWCSESMLIDGLKEANNSVCVCVNIFCVPRVVVGLTSLAKTIPA